MQEIYSLSPLQEGFLFHHLAQPDSSQYFIQASYRVSGEVRPDLVWESLRILFRRYDILRTSFITEGLKRHFQVVLEDREPVFHYEDLAGREDAGGYVNAFKESDRRRSFDLTRDVLMRVAVFRLEPGLYEFVWSHHHLLMDGWCTAQLVREFGQLYTGAVSGAWPELPAPVQYKAFIKWLERQDRSEGLRYWREYLAPVRRPTVIPFLQEGHAGDYINAEVLLSMGEALSGHITRTVRDAHTTLNIFMQAVWTLVLGLFNGQEEVVFGSVVSVRPPEIEGVENIIGLLINTVPVRARPDAEKRFDQLLTELQRDQASAVPYQYCSLADIQASSSLKQHLVNHLLVVGHYTLQENLGLAEEKNAGPLQIKGAESFSQVNYPFSIYVDPGSSFQVRFNYNASVIDRVSVDRISSLFYAICLQVTEQPGIRLGNLDWTSPAEKAALLALGSGKERPAEPGLIDDLRSLAAQLPHAVALVDDEGTMSYAEVWDKVCLLSEVLSSKGIGRGDRVGVYTGRCREGVWAFWSLWRLGAVYVPLQPGYPGERLAFMIEDAGIDWVLTTSVFFFDAQAWGKSLFAIDLQLPPGAPSTDRSIAGDGQGAAYMIYTSGTTGRPKGVPIRQDSITSRARYHRDLLAITPDDGVFWFSSVAFDASIIELTMAMAAGARLCIVGEDRKRHLDEWLDWIAPSGATIAILPPAILKVVSPGRLSGLTTIITTGEAAAIDASIGLSRRVALYNGYGPTETCVGATFYRIRPEEAEGYREGGIPIGRPFDQTQVVLLDAQGRLVPQGVTGDIWVGGIGLTPGYWNDPIKTERSFALLPFGPDGAAKRYYDTGDRGCWDARGQLTFRGRRDGQVQIRGIRVEPEEVEQVLSAGPGVREAVVVPWSAAGAELRLAAYVVLEAGSGIDPVRAYATRRMPFYMVPQDWTVLAGMPVTQNGKTDKAALPPPVLQGDATVFEAPVNEIQEKLCVIWAEVLNRPGIGIRDHFFESGGHSLKATQVVSYIFRELKVRLDVGQLFDHPTIASLSEVIGQSLGADYEAIPPAPPEEDYALTPAQHRIWILSQLEEGNDAYHIRLQYTLDGPLEEDAFKRALEAVALRHESLRTNFRLRDGRVRQFIHPSRTVPFACVSIAGEKQAAAWLEADHATVFDLRQGPLCRVSLVRLSEHRHIFSCCMHHIISDGLSIQLLFADINRAYNAALRKQEALLPLPKLQYKDYAAWMETQLAQGSAAGDYWRDRFSSGVPRLHLPEDKDRPAIQSFRGAHLAFELEAGRLQRIKNVAARQGVTPFALVLSALHTALFPFNEGGSVTTGTIVAGREHPDVHPLIGCFVNTLVLRSDFTETMTLSAVLAEVSGVLLAGYKHQSYPFDRLVEEIPANHDLSRSALFDVLVNYQVLDAKTEDVMEGLHWSTYDTDTDVTPAKTDLEFGFVENGDRLLGQLVYNTDIYTRPTAKRLVDTLLRRVDAFLEDLSMPLADVLQPDENTKRLLLARGTGRSVSRPGVGYVHLFREAVRAYPDKPALLDNNEAWTYAQLEGWSNRFAQWLVDERGVLPGDVVPVCQDRTCRYIAVVLAVWKAGAVYLPVLPEWPESMRKRVLESSGAKPVLYPGDCLGDFPVSASREEPAYDPARPMYLLYTSGSTGTPKGVMVHQEAMLNHFFAKLGDLSIIPGSVVGQTAAQSFDVSVWQMMAPLLAGGTARIVDKADLLDIASLASIIIRDRIQVLQFVPTFLSQFLDGLGALGTELQPQGLACICTTGEEMRSTVLRKLFRQFPGIVYVNGYGPTEGADNVMHNVLTQPGPDGRVALGRPIDNVRIYLMGPGSRLADVGVPAEIWIGGMAVALGYLNMPERTREVFLEDPFVPGGRVYRTGDFARWTNDLGIEFLGRKDRQVKVRGHRIELGAVERAMESYPGIRQTAVVYEADTSGGRLSGFVHTDEAGGFSATGYADWLAGRLPAYMIPGRIHPLTEWPVNHSGKTDLARLASMSHRAEDTTGLVAPATPTEERLCALWEELLDVRPIGTRQPFFSLGGHSLKAVRLISLIEASFSVRLTLQQVYQQPDIETQARLLDALRWTRDVPAPAGAKQDWESITI
jgi:amino acid adenylation domain-containing protein